VAVNQTDDWPYEDRVPLLDDFLAPRCTSYLVESGEDLPALRHLLREPAADEVETTRRRWRRGAQYARDRGLLLATGWGVGADALGWLCGLQNAVIFALERPEFLDAVLDAVSRWNRRRMELMLETEPDLFIRRAWYEGTSYWSPGLFRRFLLPRVQEEADLAHEAGAAFGYIMTVGGLEFAELLLEAGIDVLIGVDPIQDRGMDMAALKRAVDGRMCLWGGINGFVTVERGTEREVRRAVQKAMEALGPAGSILSPVDNVRDTSERTWRNVLALIDAWKQMR
jgi:hypothetical protein